LDQPQGFEFAGERAYLTFHCPRHKAFVRIGQHTIKWSKKGKTARWENKVLDDLMGHPKKMVPDFGQAPITFSSQFAM
jgi:hypothetical protein